MRVCLWLWDRTGTNMRGWGKTRTQSIGDEVAAAMMDQFFVKTAAAEDVACEQRAFEVLNAAAELLEDAGLNKEARAVTMCMEEFAGVETAQIDVEIE